MHIFLLLLSNKLTCKATNLFKGETPLDIANGIKLVTKWITQKCGNSCVYLLLKIYSGVSIEGSGETKNWPKMSSDDITWNKTTSDDKSKFTSMSELLYNPI